MGRGILISGSAPSSTLLGQPSLQLLNIFMFAALNIFRMSWFRVNYPNTSPAPGTAGKSSRSSWSRSWCFAWWWVCLLVAEAFIWQFTGLALYRMFRKHNFYFLILANSLECVDVGCDGVMLKNTWNFWNMILLCGWIEWIWTGHIYISKIT